MSALHSPRSFLRRAVRKAVELEKKKHRRPPPRPKRAQSKMAAKRELMKVAREMGWRGKSYRTAKKFERKLGRTLV